MENDQSETKENNKFITFTETFLLPVNFGKEISVQFANLQLSEVYFIRRIITESFPELWVTTTFISIQVIPITLKLNVYTDYIYYLHYCEVI